MKYSNILISDSYLSLTAASSHYQDNWVCDETLFRLLKSHYLKRSITQKYPDLSNKPIRSTRH
jgi:hypothetical protein